MNNPEVINIGEFVGDPSADPLRQSFQKTNSNFEDLFRRLANIESISLPSVLPSVGTVTGAPQSILPANGGEAIQGVSILSSLGLGANVAGYSPPIICRLSATRVLIFYIAGIGVPSGERGGGTDFWNYVVAQVLKIDPTTGGVTAAVRAARKVKSGASGSQGARIKGVAGITSTKVAVFVDASPYTYIVDYDEATESIVWTPGASTILYDAGNNPHVPVVDGMLAVPQSGGVRLLAPTLVGATPGQLADRTVSPATDHLGDGYLVTADGGYIPGSSDQRLVLYLYRVERGFSRLVDRLVTPWSFQTSGSVFALGSSSAFVSWLAAAGSRMGAFITVANDRLSLAATAASGYAALMPFACLAISSTRFVLLIQPGNISATPSGSEYQWRAIELADGALSDRETFASTHSGDGIDVIALAGDRSILVRMTGTPGGSMQPFVDVVRFA